MKSWLLKTLVFMTIALSFGNVYCQTQPSAPRHSKHHSPRHSKRHRVAGEKRIPHHRLSEKEKEIRAETKLQAQELARTNDFYAIEERHKREDEKRMTGWTQVIDHRIAGQEKYEELERHFAEHAKQKQLVSEREQEVGEAQAVIREKEREQRLDDERRDYVQVREQLKVWKEKAQTLDPAVEYGLTSQSRAP